MQGRPYPRDDAERRAAVAAGYDLGRTLPADDLVRGEDVFFAATGATGGALLQWCGTGRARPRASRS